MLLIGQLSKFSRILNNKAAPQSLPGKAQVTSPQYIEILGLLKTIAILVGIVIMLRGSVVEAFKIPSSSMEPTLQIGDHLLVNKLSYGVRLPFVKETVLQFRTPERGDVVVFTLPDNPLTVDIDESDTNIIKRVIGLPGDHVAVIGTHVLINGKELPDTYSRWARGGIKDFDTIAKIPANHVLLLGDNRDHSKDSRYWPNPFLDIHRIKGRAFIIYWNNLMPFHRMFDVIR